MRISHFAAYVTFNWRSKKCRFFRLLRPGVISHQSKKISNSETSFWCVLGEDLRVLKSVRYFVSRLTDSAEYFLSLSLNFDETTASRQFTHIKIFTPQKTNLECN